MKSHVRRLLTVLLAFTLPALAHADVRFAEVAGWWSADPEHGGESSRVALHLFEKDGKQLATLSLVAMGAYDIALGEVTLAGNSLDTKPLSFPLTWDPARQTLGGRLPADAAPVYEIPIEFRRSEPVMRPPARAWQAPRPKLLWSVETGAPVWAGIERGNDGTLYVGNEKGVVYAISRDGKVRWDVDTGKPIRAQPKLLEGDLFVHSDSRHVYRLNRASGREVWRARVDAGSEPRVPTNDPKTRWDRYGSSVVADAKRLFVASRDKSLYALDLETGRKLWRVAAGDIMTATPALSGDAVIFADYSGKVQAVSARDGTPRWSYDAKLAVPGDLVVTGDRLLLGSRSYDLIALDVATGKELWKRYYWFSWIESPAAVLDGVVYTGSSDAKHVYARNLADGSLRWKAPVPGWAWSRIAVYEEWLVAGTVGAGKYPGAPDGSLLALDRNTGELRWMLREPPPEDVAKAGTNWGFGAAPVIADGVVYAAGLDGKVYAFALTN